MQNRLFGTDGIRAKAGTYPLNQEGLTKIGLALGQFFSSNAKPILIGWDPRESSTTIRDVLTAAITKSGLDVMHLGVITTPGLAYLTNVTDVGGGVMITASHNLYEDNGIKVFLPGGKKLTDQVEDQINSLIEKSSNPTSTIGNVIHNTAMVEQYIDYLTEQAVINRNQKIAFDCANGAASNLIPEIVKRLNLKAVIINNQPDGTNINLNSGATDTKQLQKTVIDNECDLGLAFDGDADRLIAVDSKGHPIDGDVLLYILAITGNHNRVVATTMSNLGLEKALEAKKIELIRTQVGDRYVLQTMNEDGSLLGGEQSGHIILGRLATTGDGILAAVVLLSELSSSDKSLEQWSKLIKKVPQTIVNLVANDKSFLERPYVQDLLKNEQEALGHNGRVIVRPSGTEPKIRIMVEAQNAEEIAERILGKLKAAYEQEAGVYPFVTNHDSPARSILTRTTPELVRQLIEKSQQQNIRKYTPKDSAERFASEEHFDKWSSKGRIVHWLVGRDNDLAGVIWYGEAVFPSDIQTTLKPNTTFAIRLYEGYQGFGLAKPFMRQSLRILAIEQKDLHQPIDSIWLQTDLSNEAAVHVYTKVGYKEVGRDEKRVTMVLDQDAFEAILNDV